MTTTTTEHKGNGNGNGNGKQSLGAQAAAAAASQTQEPERLGVVSNDEDAVEDDQEELDEDENKSGAKRVAKKFFVVGGNGVVSVFDKARETEKFLNSKDAPEDFRVIKGTEMVRTHRIALG